MQVAMKIIDKNKIDEASLQKLKREMHIMRTLQHPHIIRLFHVMETLNELILVTEFAKNGEIFGLWFRSVNCTVAPFLACSRLFQSL